jgi:toxin FitB
MYLLDTNVISEFRKIRARKADKNVAKWADKVDAQNLYLSVITVQEMEIGARLIELRDPEQGDIFHKWLHGYVLPAFGTRILPVDLAVTLQSAKLHVPDPKPFRDSLIAATALVHKMTVVTRNVSDFERSGVLIFNPWLGAA